MSGTWLLAYVGLGGVTGLLAGLFGIGGGGIMVPALTMMFVAQGFAPEYLVHLALGTSMTAIVPTACASVLAHQRHRAVCWPVVAKLTPAVLAGTFAGTFLAARLSPVFLSVFFSLFMTLVAVRMLRHRVPSPSRQLPGVLGLSVAGTGIGGISALVAIGGGTLTVPFLAWCNLDLKRAIGTSAAVGLPIATAGAFGYIINGSADAGLPPFSFGFVYWPAVLAMASASFVTAPLGARTAHALPVHWLRRLFAILLVILALQMLTTVLRGA